MIEDELLNVQTKIEELCRTAIEFQKNGPPEFNKYADYITTITVADYVSNVLLMNRLSLQSIIAEAANRKINYDTFVDLNYNTKWYIREGIRLKW